MADRHPTSKREEWKLVGASNALRRYLGGEITAAEYLHEVRKEVADAEFGKGHSE